MKTRARMIKTSEISLFLHVNFISKSQISSHVCIILNTYHILTTTHLPIMVECCCTAASRRRSRMVHSPMFGIRRHPLGTGSQGWPLFWWAVSRSTSVAIVSFSESSSPLVGLGEVGSGFRWAVQCNRGVNKNPEVQCWVIVILFSVAVPKHTLVPLHATEMVGLKLLCVSCTHF